MAKLNFPNFSQGLILLGVLVICASYFGMELSYHTDNFNLDIDAEIDEEFYEEQLQGQGQAASIEDAAEEHARAHGIRTMAPGILGVIVLAFVGSRKKKPRQYLDSLSFREFHELKVAIATYEADVTSGSIAADEDDSRRSPVAAADRGNGNA